MDNVKGKNISIDMHADQRLIPNIDSGISVCRVPIILSLF